MHEAAVRAQHWLFDGNRGAVVEHATRVYTDPGAIWSAVLGGVDPRAASTLGNEGAAILEGAVYGSEVILAAKAAAECGADVVLADRSRAISKARLHAATLLERSTHSATQAEGALLPVGRGTVCRPACAIATVPALRLILHACIGIGAGPDTDWAP
jgi:hypothetical protein